MATKPTKRTAEPSTDQIVERERRWALRAAVATFVALGLFAGGLLAQLQVPISSQAAIQFRSFHAHATALILAGVLEAVGFLLLSGPLLYLFRAARARNPAMQNALLAFCVIGPVLFAGHLVANSFAYKSASREFVAKAPAEAFRTYKSFSTQVQKSHDLVHKVTLYTDANALEVEQSDGSFYKVRYPAAAEQKIIQQLAHQNVTRESDSSGVLGNALASHLATTNATFKLSASPGLVFAAGLSMILAVVYTALQAMRVGLLTRFVGTLGMGLGVALLLLPVAPYLIAVWFGYVGAVFIGRGRGGRPPAWEAGEAVPWPKPEPRQRGGGAIGGRGRQVEPADDTVEALGEGASNGGTGSGPHPGSAKRKRKRRR